VQLERGWLRAPYRARTLTSEEKQAIWPGLTARYPVYADYQRRTTRDIPVVELCPA
jgi:F420H(2)-dependent quinone reductase